MGGPWGQRHFPYTIVVAKDEDPSRENDKMSLWMIEMDRQGVSTAGLHKIGQQCIPFCEVYFDDVVLTEEDRVGTPGEGFMMVMKNFEVERALLVAEQLGLAQAAMEDAVTYANQRIAFNKPIANFQMTQEKLTEMEIRLQNTRNMLYKTTVGARQRHFSAARLCPVEALRLHGVL